jgi:hypothetical protein
MIRASTADIAMKTGDTRPVLAVTLTDADGNPIALSPTATVRFRMRKWGSTSLKVNSSTGITILSASQGMIQRVWASTETNSTGTYWFEFETETSTGTRTHPNYRQGTIEFTAQLA